MRAIVIGETALSVQCAQLMRQRGHEILAVSGPAAAPLQKWAADSAVPFTSDLAELTEISAGTTPDYLFSIVNYRVLPRELLRNSRVPVNYHDGPLPRYAGVYATSWAIINGETQHGITWHVMVDKVDAGDILKQAQVPVSADDTVHQLNMKCYLAAFRSFRSLLLEIESGAESRTPQDLSLRTYYGFSKWASTEVSWNWTALQIGRFCRALAFYPERNPIGEPVALLDGVRVALRSAVPCPPSGKPPGTLIENTPDYIRVATVDDDVKLQRAKAVG